MQLLAMAIPNMTSTGKEQMATMSSKNPEAEEVK
jgi:hypothetical protein